MFWGDCLFWEEGSCKIIIFSLPFKDRQLENFLLFNYLERKEFRGTCFTFHAFRQSVSISLVLRLAFLLHLPQSRDTLRWVLGSGLCPPQRAVGFCDDPDSSTWPSTEPKFDDPKSFRPHTREPHRQSPVPVQECVVRRDKALSWQRRRRCVLEHLGAVPIWHFSSTVNGSSHFDFLISSGQQIPSRSKSNGLPTWIEWGRRLRLYWRAWDSWALLMASRTLISNSVQGWGSPAPRAEPLGCWPKVRKKGVWPVVTFTESLTANCTEDNTWGQRVVSYCKMTQESSWPLEWSSPLGHLFVGV